MRLKVMRGAAGRLLGLAALLVLMTTLAVRADEKDRKKEAKPGKTEPAPEVVFPDVDELFKGLQFDIDDDHFKEMRRQVEEMRKRLAQLHGRGGMMAVPFGGFPNAPFGREARTRSAQVARLGAELRQPSATLADQLDLPKDQGMVLVAVGPNSPAARVGLKAHDILLEVDGKPVPSQREALDRLLSGIEANKKVDTVVMRKGKKETVKGLALPEAKVEARPAPGGMRGFPAFPRGGLGGGLFLPNLGGQAGLTTITRNNDEFTVRNRANGVTITVRGTMDQGAPRAGEVTIESAGQKKTYDSVDRVPREHQETVKKLIKLSGRGAVRLP